MNLHQLKTCCARGALALAISAAGSVPAFAAAPNPESVDRLLEITQIRRTLDGVRGQIEGMIRSSLQNATKDQPLDARQRAAIERFSEKMAVIMNEELSPDTQMAMIRKVYSESYTQDEINRLIALYTSENGQLLINKVPQVTQRAFQLSQERMPALMEKMRKGMQEVQAELKAAGKEKP